MTIFCCCPLRYSRKSQGDDETCEAHGVQGLPSRPPPAKLPPVANNTALSPQSTAARSSLTNPIPGAAGDSSIHVAELVIEDSEDDTGDDRVAHTSRNRSTGTLEAVKARIRRHLSQDSMARQSETEEQVARRAEVKRLMRLRIQEEIQTEGSPGLSADCASQRPASPSVSSATVLGNGPRDTIEFTVDEVKKEAELARAKAAHLSKPLEDDGRRLSRNSSKRSSTRSGVRQARHPDSCPVSICDWIEHSLEIAHADHRGHVRRRSSLPDTPASPQLRPVREASCHDAASLASWRLSLSADKLADLLTPDKSHSIFRPVASPTGSCETLDARPEGHVQNVKQMRRMSSPRSALSHDLADKQNPSQVSPHSHYRRRRIPKSNSLVRDESPVGLWLRAQSQQFRLSTASPVQSDHDANIESGGPAQDAPTDQLPISPPQRSISEQRVGELQSKSQSAGLDGFETRRRLSTEKDVRKFVSEGHSASWVPLAPSEKTTTVDAGTSIQVVVRRGFAGMRLPSFKWHNSATKDQGEQHPVPPPQPRENSTASLVHNHSRHTTLEAGSETSSFFRREAELRAVEERFRDSHLRKEPLTPVESKFHEVLSDKPRFAASHSLLSRLELTLPMDGEVLTHNFDGNGPEHGDPASSAVLKSGIRSNTDCQGHLKVPSIEYNKIKHTSKRPRFSNHKDGTPRSRGFSASKDGDETAEMWKRAMSLDPVSKSPRRSMSSHHVAPQVAPTKAGNVAQNPRAPCPSAIEGRSGPDSHDHSPICAEAAEALPQEDDEEFRRSLMRSNKILEDWGRRLELDPREARTKTLPITSQLRSSYKNAKTPPASWAKFPSHNRAERNGVAGKADNVKPRDFAVKGASAAGIIWTTDKGDERGPGHKSIARSVSDKFTHPFKSRLSKLLPGRVTSSIKDSSIRGARRSTIQGSGDLEYPELELLPTAGGYKELLALERDINEMKGLGHSKTGSSADQSAAPNNRSGLVEKMTGVLRTDGSADFDSSHSTDLANHMDGQRSMTKIHVPMTPATQAKHFNSIHGKDMTGSSVERYATPLTHFSLSRSLTPQSTTHLPLTPGSVRSTASVIRRTSLCVPKRINDLSIPIPRTELYNDRSSSRRRSAPPATPGSD